MSATAIALSGQAPLLLTPHEASGILGVNRGTLRDLRDQGTGPHYYTIGSAIRYTRSDLDEWRVQRDRANGGR